MLWQEGEEEVGKGKVTRGWKQIDECIDNWSGGEGHCCRLLVGMQRLPQEELRDVYRIVKDQEGMDNQTAIRLKKKLAEEFREQLMIERAILTQRVIKGEVFYFTRKRKNAIRPSIT